MKLLTCKHGTWDTSWVTGPAEAAGPAKVSIYIPFQTLQKQPFTKDLPVLGTGAMEVNGPQMIPALVESRASQRSGGTSSFWVAQDIPSLNAERPASQNPSAPRNWVDATGKPGAGAALQPC